MIKQQINVGYKIIRDIWKRKIKKNSVLGPPPSERFEKYNGKSYTERFKGKLSHQIQGK